MIEIFPTSEALAGAVARHIVDCAAEVIAARGRFVIALSGGSTPKAAYSRLATDDWRLIHILWGDERCVSPDDPRSNYRMAKEALLDRVPIPPDHIHRIRGEDDPERAAAEYEGELRRLLSEPSPHPERSEGSSRLCLVLLGLGDDGHTASLFPGQSAVRETARWVVAVPASSRSPDAVPRVTLTPVILNRARNVTFVVSGANKAQTLQRVVEGPFNPDVLPAQAIRPREGRLTWMVDEAAAGALRLHRAST
jgi:6-phosphogluconolactonase